MDGEAIEVNAEDEELIGHNKGIITTEIITTDITKEAITKMEAEDGTMGTEEIVVLEEAEVDIKTRMAKEELNVRCRKFGYHVADNCPVPPTNLNSLLPGEFDAGIAYPYEINTQQGSHLN